MATWKVNSILDRTEVVDLDSGMLSTRLPNVLVIRSVGIFVAEGDLADDAFFRRRNDSMIDLV